MLERLYQPDFRCIFGKNHANAFLYGQVDTLVWPVFTDIEMSSMLKNLLKLKNLDGRKSFYRRNISVEDEKVELSCSNIDIALIQAMDLGRAYGISNDDVISVVNKSPDIFRGVLSYHPSDDSSSSSIMADLKKIEKEIKVAGIVIYPSYTRLNITDKKNTTFKDLLSHCVQRNYFVKIDIGNMYFPENKPEFTSYEKIKSFLSRNPKPIFILSGLDISGDFNLFYQLLKYHDNLWIEIDPRTFGGMTPTDCFKQIFNTKGFVQNCWQRMLIGSATPTLEISQMARGFMEATDALTFSQKCILRTWALRNVNRLNNKIFTPTSNRDPKMYDSVQNVDQIQKVENDNEVNIVYKVKLSSYSVTQLLFLTDLIDDLFKEALKKYPGLKNGELFIRSYHTTTSLIVNEHEYGNYLDLHYKFAEISAQNSADFLHTVKALENRADFNHFDHELASTYGSRQLTIPIIERKLEVGGRENFYILVTFGPRTFQIHLRIRLLKEK